MENAEIIIKVLGDEIQRLIWRAEYAEKMLSQRELELENAKKKIEDLTF